MEDSLVEGEKSGLFGWVAGHLLPAGSRAWTLVSKIAILHAQRKMERTHFMARRELLKQDEQMGTLLSFSGTEE
jgi:hypothetical protein